MELTLEKELGRRIFVDALNQAGEKELRATALSFYDHIQAQHTMMCEILKQDLNFEAIPANWATASQPEAAIKPTATVSCLVEVPEAYHDRMTKLLEQCPQLDQNDLWLNALTLYLERRGM